MGWTGPKESRGARRGKRTWAGPDNEPQPKSPPRVIPPSAPTTVAPPLPRPEDIIRRPNFNAGMNRPYEVFRKADAQHKAPYTVRRMGRMDFTVDDNRFVLEGDINNGFYAAHINSGRQIARAGRGTTQLKAIQEAIDFTARRRTDSAFDAKVAKAERVMNYAREYVVTGGMKYNGNHYDVVAKIPAGWEKISGPYKAPKGYEWVGYRAKGMTALIKEDKRPKWL